MEEKGYPKYQYSVFLKNGRDEQIVVRADTFEELMEAKRNVNKILEKTEQPAQPTAVSTPKTSMSVEDFEKRTNCERCGAPMRTSRSGNWVCSKACWIK